MDTFVCNDCGYESPKWEGKCPACDSWNSFKSVNKIIGKSTKSKKNTKISAFETKPQQLKDITEAAYKKISTTVKEFDGVLGGGIVPGMVALIGGEPGIGKSTIMLQISRKLCENGLKVLYVSGEESVEQIKIRSIRLGINTDNLYLYCSVNVEKIIEQFSLLKPNFVIIDSIQSVYLQNRETAPGSVSQLRECTGHFTRIAKQNNIPIFLIGHITKEGIVAGPKIIEHMVDTVLYFEGEMNNQFKMLRTTKNRFGSTNEIGIFEMQADGLHEVSNPSKIFLTHDGLNPGTAVGCVLEGSRAFLIEVQSLVTESNYGNSQRVALGLDHKRLSLLLAVLEKYLSVNLRQSDVFINLVGGIKVIEPSLDLAVIAAILSSYKDKEIAAKTLYLGEIGLNGEIRPVSMLEKRIKEAEKLGYQRIIISKQSRIKKENKILKRIHRIEELYSILFD